MFLIFTKRQPWIVLSMFLNFCQISGPRSYNVVLIKKEFILLPDDIALVVSY